MSTPPPEDETLRDLADVADELIEQAAALRRRWTELGEALGVDLLEGVDEEDETPEVAAVESRTPAEDEPPRTPVAPLADYAEAEEPDPIRVVAFDMMLSGRTRKEVKEYVRASFGAGADLSVVDELFDSR